VAEGDRLRQEAIDEARLTREDADAAAVASAAASEAAAQAALDAARDQGRQMVEEARTYRERVIADLADRRRTARSQLDGIAATRDALAVTLSDVASGLATSQRLLNELEIDATSLGDVSADRAVLEAHDASRPALAEEPGHASTASDDGDGDGVADDESGDDEAAGDPVDVPSEEMADEPVEAEDLTSDQAASEVIDHEEPVEAVEEPQPEVEPEPAGVADEPEAQVDDDGEEPVIDPTDDAPGGRPDTDAEPDPEVDPASESLEEAIAEADVANGEGDPGEGDPGDGDQDLREGRIDQIFAKIRADRHDEPEGDGNSAAAVAVVDPEVAADDATAETVVDTDPDTDLLDRRDAELEEVEKQLARRLKRVLADEQNETLDLLRRTKGTPTVEGVLPGESDHQERYRSAALEDLSAAERAGAGFFGAAPDRRADVFDVAGDFASEILRQIRAQLIRALDDGGDEYELGDRIRSCYREWKTQRIADTARHFVMVAFSRGVAEAADDGDSFRWLMDDGGQPCPDCDDNQLGGAVPKGEAFPTGDLCPPAHPGCRCLAVPVP
jgi:hypothetical protein